MNVKLYSEVGADWSSYEENPVATGKGKFGAQVYNFFYNISKTIHRHAS